MNWPARLLAAVFYAVSCQGAHAAAKCTDAQRAAGEKALQLSAGDKDAALAKHLPWGLPESKLDTSAEQLLVNRDYVVKYHRDLHVPIWVAYSFDAGRLRKNVPRVDCFRADDRVTPKSASATPDDYDEPRYDQGHLAPAEDMSTSVASMVNSFLMTNMTPQEKKFNEVIWRNLETKGRTWGKLRKKPFYVVTGSVFDRDGDGKRDKDSDAAFMKSTKTHQARVAVPSHFFKILVHQCNNGSVETLAFILPHDNKSHTGTEATAYLESEIVPIADIERVTGLTFFPKAHGSARFEKLKAHDMWPLKGSDSCGGG